MTGLGVTLGVASIIATFALVTTIRFQVSDEFDALLATQVELRARTEEGAFKSEFPPAFTIQNRVIGMSGVEGMAVVREALTDPLVALSRVVDLTAIPDRVSLYGMNAAGFEALDTTVSGPGWSQWHDESAQRVAVVAASTADRIGAADIAVGDSIYLEGVGFSVVGVLEDSPRLPALADSVIVPATTVAMFELDSDRDRIIVITAPGAAQQVASALAVAVSPAAPETWTAYSAQDDDTLRRSIDNQVQGLALGLGAVVLVLGAVSIGNATLTSVMQRTHEIGLRRALGARPRHIASHILLDAVIVGLIGGVLGVIVGLTATLSVTALQGWIPVLNPSISAMGVIGGVVAGAVAGIYPARIGRQVQPIEALRRE